MSNNHLPMRWESAKSLTPEHPLISQWLTDQASLTRRLETLSQGAFSVTPLFEGKQALREDECHALKLAPNTPGWVREVHLQGANTPWVFARSVASLEALTASGFALESLGRRSLGELLFQDPAFTRGPLSACRYPSQGLPDGDAHTSVWARRSCFTQGALGILVMEAFLPAFWQQLNIAP